MCTMSGDTVATLLVHSYQKYQMILMLTGVYTIADEGSDARLMYKLEIPEEPKELQEQLNIGKTGDYSLQIKVCSSRQTSPSTAGFLPVSYVSTGLDVLGSPFCQDGLSQCVTPGLGKRQDFDA